MRRAYPGGGRLYVLPRSQTSSSIWPAGQTCPFELVIAERVYRRETINAQGSGPSSKASVGFGEIESENVDKTLGGDTFQALGQENGDGESSPY